MDLVQYFDFLMEYGGDTASMFSARNAPKRFWRNAGKWNTGTFRLTDELSREWSSQ